MIQSESCCFQVLDLSTQEMEWVATHLGHTLDVERNYYRVMSTTIEKAKIAKLLLMADAGMIDKYSGKKLNDINLDGKYLRST